LVFQKEEKKKRAAVLIIADKELTFQSKEKENRAAELIIANKELTFQNREKEKRAAELIIANKELAFQNEEKEKRAAELIIANNKLTFQNKEKEKRAAELIIANKELVFQNKEKEKRAAELIIANKELAYQNEEKEKRAAELIIANKELAFQNREKEKRAAELDIANKEMEAFSYSVSHDLSAPLRHINGYVELLLSRFYDFLPDKARHYLNNIADSASQMATLIDDLLQFSRTGLQEMRLADLNMNIIVQEVLAPIKQDNRERNIEWRIATLPHVYGDHAMLRLVWTNLLSNAVKFTRTREKTIIEINVIDENDAFIFSIRDNGVGFDMQYAQKLFGVFQRLHTNDEFEGTGIGLANVHRIILKHGGHIWAEAEPDKGATFIFSLPKNKED
ncbi:MAG: ATP-binding protein, partial [Bacteroidales bacterium]